MRSLTKNETSMISGSSSFTVQKMGDGKIIIVAFMAYPNSLLEFNNLTFSINGCFYDGWIVHPDDSYSGFHVATIHNSDTHRTFELSPV